MKNISNKCKLLDKNYILQLIKHKKRNKYNENNVLL